MPSSLSPPATATVAPSNRAIALWLATCCGMVVAMMLIGAVTRLTESGLSMVEWRPLIGSLPPLSEAEWQRVFALYRETSEYQLANAGMSLAEFKTIFWWEYIHRVWGRLIGLVFALPFFWFLLRRRIPPGLTPHLTVLLALGALQGVIGWWMVKSGFVDRTDVSQYRLAVHLGMAFLILGYMLWLALGLLRKDGTDPLSKGLRRGGWALMAVVSVTVVSGALVAGLNAGLVYNEWPLMGAGLVPAEYTELQPFWRNLFDNPGAVQFDHRLLAYLTAGAVVLFWIGTVRAPASRQTRLAALLLMLTVAGQVLLGIATVLTSVPLALGVLHQAGAITLFCLTVWAVRSLHA